MKVEVNNVMPGSVVFVNRLKKKFGSSLGFANEFETKSFISKVSSFYNAVKDAHRGQGREDGGEYFSGHIKPVADIVLSFPDATLRDVVIALGHDFVEDHRELSFSEALSHIKTTRGPVRGPTLVTGINNLTKYELSEYFTGDLKIIYDRLKNPEERKNFLVKNKKEFGLVRADKYFENLEKEGSDGDLRVKAGDSIHNLISCVNLSIMKIEKTISEKEQFLLPMLRNRKLTVQADALEYAISVVKLVLLQKKRSDETAACLKQIFPKGFQNVLIDALMDIYE